MKFCAYLLFFLFLLARPSFCYGLENGSKQEQEKEYNIEIAKKAESGDAKAQFNLGLMYDEGISVEKDYRKAVKWYRKAAEQGLKEAQFNLGEMYYKGEGVEQDYKKAVELYYKSSEQGCSRAQYNLGFMYLSGYGIEKNIRKAVEYYRKAADQGLALAQHNLGVMYSKGYGVEKDDRQAVEYYKKAADQKLAEAESNLGVKYMKGEGVSQDIYLASKYLKSAAEQGVVEAQSNIALLYAAGKGVQKNYIESYKWFLLAERNGLDVSKYKRLLKDDMVPEQISQAEEAAKRFLEKKTTQQKNVLYPRIKSDEFINGFHKTPKDGAYQAGNAKDKSFGIEPHISKQNEQKEIGHSRKLNIQNNKFIIFGFIIILGVSSWFNSRNIYFLKLGRYWMCHILYTNINTRLLLCYLPFILLTISSFILFSYGFLLVIIFVICIGWISGRKYAIGEHKEISNKKTL